ncbi:myosin-9 [Uranotaenia lowii]|uniref:myosin-9 n=1 Tax=Uranotaenia lowii TaxID=190385 RepID=UPI00247ABDA8|nr:myosin-9 [Uranotaenia lowii]
MFKKLKEKITEEVKQSPQRLEQLSKGFQAAVSSASSTTSEISGSENFFSITEDDTPQNSPLRHSQTLGNSSTPIQSQGDDQINNNGNTSVGASAANANNNSSNASGSGSSFFSNITMTTNTGANINNGVSPTINRTRRLSNSSMASDVSFRLPAYDSPAIYHLETDVDISASETESVSGAAMASTNGQLDLVSKEKLFQAYKKALDRYQKYRERYTELARRYRELEKDNTKARSVLVETQDKALRRISELREQCSLEQQAKAHLDSNLRMEIDELQCVVKTLKTKLEAFGDNPDKVDVAAEEKDLISLASADSGFEGRIRQLEDQLAEEKRLKDVLRQEVIQLKKREEEHSITVAENKMAIHSELESKETEVKKLKEQLQSIEKNMKQVLLDKHSFGKEITELKNKLAVAEKAASKVKDMESTIAASNDQKNKLESKFIDFERKIMELEKEKNRLGGCVLDFEKENANLTSKLKESESKFDQTVKTNGELTEKIKNLEKLAKSFDSSDEVDALKKEISEISIRKEELHSTVQSNQNELQESRLKYLELEKAFEENEAIVKGLHEQIAKQKSEQEEKSSILESVQHELEEKRNKLIQMEDEIIRLKKTVSLDQEQLAEVTQALDAAKEVHDKDRASNEASLKEVFDQNNHLTVELKQFKDKLEKVNSKFKKITEEKTSLKSQNDQLQSDLKTYKQEINTLTQQKVALAEEIRNMKIINEQSESEALQSLQESMRASLAQAEERLLETTRDLNHVIELKSEENRKLSDEKDEMFEKQDVLQKEKDDLATETSNLKLKIDSLKNEKKDLEKTLEREIREKTELKTQVTNILQEIGRLEEQLTDVKNSHSAILNEKQSLEEKIERLQKQHTESKQKADKETNHKWQTKLKELETKLQQVECENSQLAEKNCLLEENNRRTAEEIKKLQAALQDAESVLKAEKKKAKEELRGKCQELEDKVKQTTEQLNQCTGDHAKLFNEKELLDHQHRSLQDALEAKEKEKLCVLDNNKCLTEELESIKANFSALEDDKLQLTAECDQLKIEIDKCRSEKDYLQGKQSELKAKMEKQNEILRKEIEIAKNCNQNKLAELEALVKKSNDEKQSFSKKVTDLENNLENYEQIKIENEFLNTTIKQLEDELQSLKEEKNKLNAAVNGKDAEINSIKGKISQSESAVEGKDQEIKKLINEFVCKEQELKAKILTLEHGKADAEKRCKEATTNFEKIGEELKVLKERHAENKQTLEEKVAEAVIARDELKSELERTKTELEGTMSFEKLNRSDLEQESEQLKQQVENLQQENERLKKDSQTIQELRLENENFIRDLDEMKNELNVAIADKLELTQQHSQLKEKFDAFNAETEENVLRFKQEMETLKQQQVSNVSSSLVNNNNINEDDEREERNKAFDDMRNRKDELENKLKKIMHEVQDVSNRNLFLEQKCENYLILEQSNERLKLQNEKLSRQLDETLVSMHHHEGIAANTEFEYLRNILFQYLSGSVNGNNSTLVKVIAAVLKFTPQQTQVVLEKEAHRRSLMGHLL